MNNRTQRLLCIFLIATLITSISIFTNKVSAQTTKISVEPSSIIDTSIEPGDTFTVNITVTDVTNLYGWQVKFYFSPTLLECTSATVPPDNVFAGKSIQAPPASIDNTAGNLLILAILVGVQPGVNVTKAILCKITFEVKSRGQTDLTLGDLGRFTYMLDPNGQKIPFTGEHGFFDNSLPVSPAALSINPKNVIDPTLTPCNNFTINITIDEATNLYQWNASLYYKNDILNITDTFEGSFLQSGGTTSFQSQIQNNYNATHGRLTVSCTLVGAIEGVDGSGVLANVTFHVIGLGNTTITLSQTALYDETHTMLSHSTSDGYFNNELVAKLSVIPPEIIDPSLLPPANFSITVAIDDVENLYGYEFNLTYNTNIVTCYGIVFHSPLGESYFRPNFEVNDDVGFIWVKVDFYPPATPIQTYTNEALVTIFFRVEGLGCTVLNLTNTHVIDPDGLPIHHEAYNGFFCTLIRDVAVTNVVPLTDYAFKGWIVYINVTLFNKGNLTETFDVNAYYGNSSLIGTLTVENLAPENETTITFAWDTIGTSPCNNYTIWAEAIAVPYEINTTDNIYIDGKVKILMMGDVNHDGVVELMDFQIVGDAYGSYPGHPRWNPEADLNQDGIVELLDFLMLSSHFGDTCSP